MKTLIQAGHNFVIEENGDFEHGPSKSNFMWAWKQKNGMEIYFNCNSSPDLAPIENYWQPFKQIFRNIRIGMILRRRS